MLTSCYAVEGHSDKFEGFILIVDDYSLNILNQTIKMRETLEKGVYGIEKIQLNRKPFPRLNAVYFIQPTIENLRKIADDFNAKDPEE
jgi:syntaxin-binding protein 1